MRRGLAPALVALACLGIAPATAHSAPGDIGISDEGNWFGSSGRVLRVPSGGAASLLAGGAPLSDPMGVAVAADGALLVADEGAEAVFSIDPSGAVDTVVSGHGLQDPMGIVLAPDGKAYISDRQRDEVLRLDLATGALSHVADVQNATGLAMDKAGKLLVTDGVALRRIDPGTGAITTVATGAPLDDPRDVAVQQDGTLYVAGDHQVVRVNPANGREVRARDGRAAERSARDRHRARRRPRGGRRPVRRRRRDPRRPRDRGQVDPRERRRVPRAGRARRRRWRRRRSERRRQRRSGRPGAAPPTIRARPATRARRAAPARPGTPGTPGHRRRRAVSPSPSPTAGSSRSRPASPPPPPASAASTSPRPRSSASRS